VPDCQNNTIKKYDNNGVLLKEWGSKGSNVGQFNYPADIIDKLYRYIGFI